MAQPEIIQQLSRMNYLFVSVSSVVSMQTNVRIIKNHLGDIHEKQLKIIETNLQTVREWMDGNKHVEWVEPPSGSISFPRLKVDINSRDLAEHVIEKYDTYFAPGSFFGYDKHFRLGICEADNALFKQGLENISKAVKDLAG